MLSVIIFSKDRPLQLDLAIKSLKKNLSIDSSIVVIYSAHDEYDKAYIQLIHEHLDIRFYNDIEYNNDDEINDGSGF